MKKITDEFVEEHLKDGVSHMMPDAAQTEKEIWEKTVVLAHPGDWYLEGVPVPESRTGTGGKIVPFVSGGRKRSARMPAVITGVSIAAIALVAALVVSLIFIFGGKPVTTVYMDVNPSIVFKANDSDEIVSVEALNSDGEDILDDLDLEKKPIRDAVGEVLDSMVEHGYLSTDKNAVLLSAESTSRERAEEIEEMLREDIEKQLRRSLGSALILVQEILENDSLDEIAEECGISRGKAALLQRISQEHPEISIQKMAGMTIDEIADYLKKHHISLKAYTEVVWESEEAEAAYRKKAAAQSEADDDDDDADDDDDRKSSRGGDNDDDDGDSDDSDDSADDADEDDADDDDKEEKTTKSKTRSSGSSSSKSSAQKDDDNDDDDADDDDDSRTTSSSAAKSKTAAAAKTASRATSSVSSSDDDDDDDDDDNSRAASSAASTAGKTDAKKTSSNTVSSNSTDDDDDDDDDD